MPPQMTGMVSDTLYTPYTDHPMQRVSAIFPNHTFQILANVLNLACLSVITWTLSRRTSSYSTYNFFRPSTWKDFSWPRVCVILVFVISWAFIFISGVLINGAGLSYNITTCMLGIYTCVVLYAATKVLIYAFLIEKVWIVWSQVGSGSAPSGLRTRWKSPIWRVCFVLMLPYIAIFTLMLVGKIAEIRTHDRVCIIGLQKLASIPLLTFDLFITFFLTALFVQPLRRTSLISPKLRQVASRTLLSSAAALTTSAINIAILTSLHGRQLGWVCLSSCALDVTLNALVLFWVTTGTSFQHRSGHAAEVDADGGPPLSGHDVENKIRRLGSNALSGGRVGRRPEDEEFSDDEEPEFEKGADATSHDGSTVLHTLNDSDKHEYSMTESTPKLSSPPLTNTSANRPPKGSLGLPGGSVRSLVPTPVFPASAHRSPTAQRNFTDRGPRGQILGGPGPSRTGHSGRPDSAKSRSLRESGVIVIRPKSSGAHSTQRSVRGPMPSMMTSVIRESGGSVVKESAKALLKGLGGVLHLGTGGPIPKSDSSQSMSVQVTVTTEMDAMALRRLRRDAETDTETLSTSSETSPRQPVEVLDMDQDDVERTPRQ